MDLPSLFTVYQPFNHPEFLQHLKNLRPATAEYPERYADFTFLSAVSTRRIQELYASDKQGILRLTEPGWYLLTGKLAHHFARGERE